MKLMVNLLVLSSIAAGCSLPDRNILPTGTAWYCYTEIPTEDSCVRNSSTCQMNLAQMHREGRINETTLSCIPHPSLWCFTYRFNNRVGYACEPYRRSCVNRQVYMLQFSENDSVISNCAEISD